VHFQESFRILDGGVVMAPHLVDDESSRIGCRATRTVVALERLVSAKEQKKKLERRSAGGLAALTRQARSRTSRTSATSLAARVVRELGALTRQASCLPSARDAYAQPW
jgi:hypothetical protein